MIKYLLIVCLFVVQSCTNKNNNEIIANITKTTLKTSKLIEAQKIKLYQSPFNNSVYFYFGPYSNKIFQYKMNSKECLDSFYISEKVGMIEDFEVVNDTFVFHLYNVSNFALQPLKDTSNCKIFNYPELYKNYYISYGSKYFNNFLYSRFPIDCRVGTKEGWAKHFESPLVNIFKFEADSIKRIDSFGNYPNEYKTGLLFSMSHLFLGPIDNNLYVSHDLSDYIEVYDLLTKKMTTFKMTSNYFKEIQFTPEDKVGDSYYENKIINNNCFVDFIYNPYRKEFYRYFIHKSKTNEKNDLASILISKLGESKVSEIVIEREKYTRGCQIYPTQNGFKLLENLKTKKSNKRPLIIDEFILE